MSEKEKDDVIIFNDNAVLSELDKVLNESKQNETDNE